MTKARQITHPHDVPRFFPDASVLGGMRKSMLGDYMLMPDYVKLLQKIEVLERKLAAGNARLDYIEQNFHVIGIAPWSDGLWHAIAVGDDRTWPSLRAAVDAMLAARQALAASPSGKPA